MSYRQRNIVGFCCLIVLLFFSVSARSSDSVGTEAEWADFMAGHNMAWQTLPKRWQEAPHFGNAMIGSMLYTEGDQIRLQVFRGDVQDHRGNEYGWTAYSRPRLLIGDFYLKPVGKLTGCDWTKDLWNAELTGTITTDKGQIQIRHFVHAEDMAIVTELAPSEGETGFQWFWKAHKAETTRPGYPRKTEEIEGFAKRYGDHYRKTLKLFTPNPDGQLKESDDISSWVQDLLAGGQYVTAWTELKAEDGTRTHIATITNSYPEKTAAEEAVGNLKRFRKVNRGKWTREHRQWWHEYYPQSFVSIPDKSLESLYWQTIYRLGCNSRGGRLYIDTAGMWFQETPWAYSTHDHNTQVAHWPVYPANRLDQGQALVDAMHAGTQAMIDSTLPEEWRSDSAYLHLATGRDMYGPRDQDRRYWECVGNLPWVMHNCWLQYRYSMDDDMLREKIYPLLRRSINLYLHLIVEGDDGKIHLPVTFSPESASDKNCNFDLGLMKWGCQTLLQAAERLGIDDPLIPTWKDVLERSVDYPVDQYGFRIGQNKTSPRSHRHGSHFIMAYPLYLVNIEQPGTEEVLQATLDRFKQGTSHMGMKAAYAGPLAASIGDGNGALKELNDLKEDLHPNGLWFGRPCIEVSLSMATIIHDMLIQSWGDTIRVFPVVPDAWVDVRFDNLRTEGAFLVSAARENGKTRWVRIKSLAGEACRLKTDLDASMIANDKRVTLLKDGIIEIRLKQGEEIQIGQK